MRGAAFGYRASAKPKLRTRKSRRRPNREARIAKPGSPLLDAELFAGFGAQSFRGPRWSPNYVDGGVADAGELFEARFHLRADINVLGTAGRRQGHVDGDVLLRLDWIGGCLARSLCEVYFVNEAEVDNVHWDLGVVAAFQRAEDVLFGDSGHGRFTSEVSGRSLVQLIISVLDLPVPLSPLRALFVIS